MDNEMLIISSHATNRLKERTVFPKNKFFKVANKALASKLPLPENYLNLKEYVGQSGIYRNYMGYIWVFDIIKNHQHKKILVTVYKP